MKPPRGGSRFESTPLMSLTAPSELVSINTANSWGCRDLDGKGEVRQWLFAGMTAALEVGFAQTVGASDARSQNCYELHLERQLFSQTNQIPLSHAGVTEVTRLQIDQPDGRTRGAGSAGGS